MEIVSVLFCLFVDWFYLVGEMRRKLMQKNAKKYLDLCIEYYFRRHENCGIKTCHKIQEIQLKYLSKDEFLNLK